GEMFHRYAKYYDLINRDKPYDQEVAYVASRLRTASPSSRAVLELGSGTGRHGQLLAGAGFDVLGIERSPEMVALAHARELARPGSFKCEVGDIRGLRLARRFDAVISLFHVMSYQTTDEDFAAVLQTAANHLSLGAVFLFDVWHGPAVVAQRPSVRVKTV